MSAVFAYFTNAKLNWQLAWQSKSFRYKLFAGIFFIIIILICYPFFFQYIEKRNGLLINDVILKRIPAFDVYYPIFILIWSCALLMLSSAVKYPNIFIIFLLAYILLSVTRVVSILLFPLETPPGIIALVDPLANHFYGVPFITKDLFFSGHVSTLFLMFLCQHNKLFKYYTLISCFCVSILVLVQHIHYSIDVIFAFPFAYLCYQTAKYITIKEGKKLINHMCIIFAAAKIFFP